MRKFYSFSGGVESTTMALMFGHDAMGLFADTGWEHPEMYERLDRVEGVLAEIHGEQWQGLKRVRRDGESLDEYIKRSRYYPSPMARFCTRMFKIEPMDDFLASQGECELMIGLNAEEAQKRTGNHGLQENVTYTYPLVDLGTTREDCLSVLSEYDLAPELPIYMRRGGCVGCFYKSKEEYRAMVHLAPEQIEGVAELERAIQDARGTHYGVRDGIPNLTEFIANESNALFEVDELYPEQTVKESTPCGVFCHR